MKRIMLCILLIVLFLKGNYPIALYDLKNRFSKGELSREEVIKKAKELNININEDQLQKLKSANQNTDSLNLDSLNSKNTTDNKIIHKMEEGKEKKVSFDSNKHLIQKNQKELQKDSLSKYFGYEIFFNRTPKNEYLLPASVNYQVGPGDEIIINIWGETEFRISKVVDNSGVIYLDNVGQVVVNGLNLEDLHKKLLKVMTRSYATLSNGKNDAKSFLDISIGKIKPVIVHILGNVKSPGSYTISSSTNFLQALINAGGIDFSGSLRSIRVIRENKILSEIDLYKYLTTGKDLPSFNMINGDRIYVPPRFSSVELYGAVEKEAIYEIKPQETLADVVRYSGGLSVFASTERVVIERYLPLNERQDEKSIYTVIEDQLFSSGKINKIPLCDKDKIKIFRLQEDLQNYVKITGAVKYPGIYSLEANMTLENLLKNSGGLLGTAFMEYADLTHQNKNQVNTMDRIDLRKNHSEINLANWDHIHVYDLWEFFQKPSVFIEGHIKNKGVYPFVSGMKVSDLIRMSGNLKDSIFWSETYQVRADIIRTSLTGDHKEIIPIRLDSLMNNDLESYDVDLYPQDRVYIYPRNINTIEKYVKIEGYVKNPGIYPYCEKMTIHDLLLQAGGFKEDAYRSEAKVYRTDPYAVKDGHLANVFNVTLSSDMLDQFQTGNFILENRDIVNIRRYPDFRYQRMVELRGEVLFPGKYALLKKDEALKDFINRAGGLTEEAFIKGISFMRNGNRVVGNFEEVYKENSMVLRDGDVITIPRRLGMVEVRGFVNSEGMLNYNKNWDLDDYIEAAGGIKIVEGMEATGVVVYYASGHAKVDGFWSSPDIEDGCKIMINSRVVREKDIDWTEVVKEWSIIASSIATTVYIITR